MHKIEYLPYILILLSASVFIVALFHKIKISAVLGYLVAGIIVGHYFPEIRDNHTTKSLAEFGVVFLLFAIGLELTLERLKTMWRQILIFGSSQFIVTSIIIGLIAYFITGNKISAFVIGTALALSSTAIVMKTISRNRIGSTNAGRNSLAILLLQDLAVVPLLVLIPLLGSGNIEKISSLLIKFTLQGGFALIAIFLVGRFLLNPIFRVIVSSRNNELFVATTLLIALGSSWFTHHMGLSLALGAFMAGLMVAETEHQHNVEVTIIPFRGIFLGLFFMTIGMLFDLELIVQKFYLIVLFSILLISVKMIVTFTIGILLKNKVGTSLHSALLLAQGGEFAFFLFGLAGEVGILERDIAQLLLMVTGISMALTPALAFFGRILETKIDKSETLENINRENINVTNHVIITGFGRVGKIIARFLTAENIKYVAIDNDLQNVKESFEAGYNVYYGSSSETKTLKAMGVSNASAMIITIPDHNRIKKTIKFLQKEYPDLPVAVRAEDLEHKKQLEEIGVTSIIPATYETAIQLTSIILKAAGIGEKEKAEAVAEFREIEESKAETEESEES